MANIEPKKNALANTEGVPVENTGAASLFQQAKGFWVTFSKQFQKKLTYNYPEEKPPVEPRFHGRHQLDRKSTRLKSSHTDISRMPSSA